MPIHLSDHFPLSIEDIEYAYPPQIFQRGVRYFQSGRVKSLIRTGPASWVAKVQGQHERYEVHVERETEQAFQVFCHCPANENWGVCKHQVAVLLALGSEWSTYQDQWQSRMSPAHHLAQRLVHTFRELAHTQADGPKRAPEQAGNHSVRFPDRQTLKLTYLLHGIVRTYADNELSALMLELKAGVEREYVVKDIASFLNHLEQQPYPFTPRFTYDPAEHRLEESDRHIVQLIQKHLAEYRFVSEEQLIVKDKRYLLLTPGLAGELLPLLSERQSLVACRSPFGSNHVDARMIYLLKFQQEQPLPLTVRVTHHPATPEQASYALDLNEWRQWYNVPDYGLVLKEGTFYPVAEQDRSRIRQLFQTVRHLQSLTGQLQEELYLPLGPDLVGQVLQEVVNPLDGVVKVEVDKAISRHLVRQPVQTVIDIFQHKPDGPVGVNVFHHYGPYIFPLYDDQPYMLDNEGLKPVTEEVIVIRDQEHEQRVMDLLENAPLTVTTDGLAVEPGEEALYQLMFDTLPQLEAVADIYLDETLERIRREAQLDARLEVDVPETNDWLEINFHLEGLDEARIAAIVRGLKEKRRFVRFANGTVMPLNQEALQVASQVSDALSLELNQLLKEKVRLPLFRAWQIDQLLRGHRQMAHYSRAFRQLLAHLRQPETQHFDLPSGLKTRLREYQEEGFAWFKTLSRYGLGGILADEMGLGKTVQAIAYLLSEWEEGLLDAPALIVAPTSLIYNWRYELERFAPQLAVTVLDGTPSERAQKMKRSGQAQVWITSYPLLRQDQALYAETNFSVLILDEAQQIKNYQSKTFAAVLSLTASRRFALTGTPIENRLEELWAILQAVLPGLFPKRQRFVKLSTQQVRQVIQPFILRRLKQDVLTELPARIEHVQFSELTREQKALYLHYLEQTKAETRETLATEGLAKGRIKILAALTRLRQICCHPSLFVDNYRGSSGKLEQLVSLVRETVSAGRRPVLFSQFTSMLALIQAALAKEGLATFYLDGQTAAHERVKMVEAFNQGERDLFLISLKAGGTGLNLTGADTVILYDLWWNPAVDEQAIGRAHRLGQKKVVQVIRLLAQGTIEEKIYALQQKKKALIDDVLTHDEALLGALSEEELREILDLK
ncbi:SNF2-related protein [Caldalkalibacillus thermarum TA2.A1]|uniref:DEAD/DEAH box helicase n=1 Tax=Caldalkalibacillus thermarum (strain TA2.A1) TaxID=986075 RepID=F5L4B0_CALTT|nr:DEAD/DEAH box helicase [Caldalkalibacillus thermarum]EGL83828.1 SNF2-related protein [Caldalkalibacillus thermarum TA2.A1]QZT34518.1 DEAD/DEAH box helicase [Caldalkalibacillus thermarum TA2.A1]